MNAYRKTAIIVGVLFLVAMVTSLVGGIWLESILYEPGSLVNLSTYWNQVVTGVLLELINGISIIGIAVMMFPILKKQNEALALGYVALRIVEAVIIVAAVISPLVLLSLSKEYLTVGAPDSSYFQTLGVSLLAAREHLVGHILGIFFSLAALLFYYLLYQSSLIPRWISVWGFIAVVLVLSWNLLETFGIIISAGMILALPMILNEIFLAIWLIIKGFNPSATVFQAT